MKRRPVLALLAGAASAGCLGGGVGLGTTNRTTVTAPEECPPFDSDVKEVFCSPGADEPLSFDSGGQSGSLPRAEFDFTLTNEASERFEVNFYGWSVWKYVRGEWFRVAPRGYPVPLMYLDPGDSHSWHLTVDNSDLDRPIPRAEGTEEMTVVGLGGGTYAFGTDGWFSSRSHEDQTGVATHFELTGDQIPLEPVGIDRTERDGDRVLAYDEPTGNGDRAVYRATRVENSPEEPRRMITEQVLRRRMLRNALAHFESGVRQVRLESGTTAYPAFGVGETRYVEYEGETYSIETERLEGELD